MRVGDFELAVVARGSRQRLPEVEGQDGKCYTVAAPGKAFEVLIKVSTPPSPNRVYLVR